MRDEGIISDTEYDLYASGTSPGILCSLPKIHKPNIPVHPILSTLNTPNYKLSKFIIPHTEHLADSEYILKNSKEFFDVIKDIRPPDTAVMASFDVESLYTNILVKEIINIITDALYNSNNFRNMVKAKFKKLLTLIIEDNYLFFIGELYEQIDGLSMGNPIFNEFPLDFRPMIYIEDM